MIKKVLSTIIAMLFGMSMATAGTLPVFAENEFTQESCSSITDAGQREALGCNDGGTTAPKVVTNLLQVAISIVGIVSVVMIIVAGQRFITAQGDPAQVQQSKNMILYSVIGLIVAILSFAIVTFISANIFAQGA